MTQQRPRILVIAYACDPDLGSEKGAGWAVLASLLSFGDCTVIVPAKHQASLVRESANRWGDQLVVHAIDESNLAKRFLQRPRVRLFLAYLLWLRKANETVTRLTDSGDFDLCWHATYSTYWLPSPLRFISSVPTIWGPVGGAVTIDDALLGSVDLRTRARDLIDRVVTRSLAQLPSVRRTHRVADRVLFQNLETRRAVAVQRGDRPGDRVVNHALGTAIPQFDPDASAEPFDEPDIIWVGGLDRRKGPQLALRSFALLSDERQLTVVGDGPLRSALGRLAIELGIAHRVTFTGRVDRSQVPRLVSSARTALFTGLHEEGGLALAEALMLGTPTVVLGTGGARVIAERALGSGGVRVVEATLDQAEERLALALDELGSLDRDRTPMLDPAMFTDELRSVTHELIGAST